MKKVIKKRKKKGVDLIGELVHIPTNKGVNIPAEVLDFIPSYGRERYLVKSKVDGTLLKVEKLVL